MNIRVDLDTTIMDGMGVVFRSPVDCSQITGLIVYYQENGNTSSKEFVFSDAHGYNVGDIDHLFAENAVVKVILDVTTGMAFVQNADTNAYLEDRFEDIENMISAGGGGSVKSAVLYIPQTLTEEQKAQVRSNIGAMGIYLGSGDMPENCNVQIDPDGDVFGDVLLYTKQTLTEEQKAQARANIGAADDALFDKTYLANNILNPANSESGYYDTALTKMPSAKHMRTITPIPVEPNSYLYLNTTFVTADTSIIVCVMQLNGDGEYVSQISRKFLDLEPVQIGSNTSWVHVWISGANSGNSFEKLCISTKPLDGFEEYTDEAKRTLKESALPERVAQWEARISALENADEEESGDRAVLYIPQTLTEEQKAQARANIGAKAEPAPVIVSDNQFDAVFDETGYLDATTGEEVSDSTNVRTGFRTVPDGFNGVLYLSQKDAVDTVVLFAYDAEKNLIGYILRTKDKQQVGTLSCAGAKYYRVYTKDTNAAVASIYISHINPGDYANVDYSYEVGTVEETNANSPLHGKTIVNFGDSIFGNRRPPNDISTELARLTGATVHNCGFGGCRMSNHSIANFDAFSMYNLADAIAAQNFSVQDTAIANGKTATTEADGKLPAYFEESLELLKSIDFSKVDIITIAYGTNDFTGNKDLDNGDNAYDTTKFAGALRHSIEALLAAYPHLKIFVCSQTYRFWMDASNIFTDDSDTHEVGGKKLTDFVAKTKDVAKEYHLPYINNYDIGMNKHNRSIYFSATDGTHPILAGCHLIAAHIAKELF